MNNIENKLKILNLKRDRKHKVGKRVGDSLWIHKIYMEEVLPQDTINNIQNIHKKFKLNLKEKNHIQQANIIRYSEKSGGVALIFSEDFDTNDEPTVGDSIFFDFYNNKKTHTFKNKNPLIYHHKWMMVKDDYKGFNVEKAKKRSIKWKSILGVNKSISSKIGRKDFWEQWIIDNNIEEKDSIWKTLKEKQLTTSAKTSINSNKTPAGFNIGIKNQLFKPNTINLDIGGGSYDNATKLLKDYKVTNLVYDPYNRTEIHNLNVIKQVKDGGADSVTIHNVLNVIKEDSIKENILKQAKNALKEKGILMISVYEGTREQQQNGPKQTGKDQWQEFKRLEEYIPLISKYFPDFTIKNKMLIAKNTNIDLTPSPKKKKGQKNN